MATSQRNRPEPEERQPRLPALALGALGVVFGDIGTNPLYALRQCFQNLPAGPVDAGSVLGIVSLIFWSLIVVVCIKYLTFIIRADHEGEGGTLALLAKIESRRPPARTRGPGPLALLILFGSGLLLGDGVITPSISVMSAVEGVKVAAPGAQHWVVPISLVILVALFLLQSRGTGQVGWLFGPVMAVWFLSLAALGVGGIVQAPRILGALNPAAGAIFLAHHGGTGFLVFGAVVLAFSGAEALFADLSHFGRAPIRLAWYGLVLPALVLNFFGQGALVLLHPAQTKTPFFAAVPHPLLWPMVVLATAATIIASQALISGAFTLVSQAVHLGYAPRFDIVHTSSQTRGQVYIGAVNYALMAACVAIVLGFRSSENLGGAYGLAVIGTMTISSIAYCVVARRVWRWPRAGAFTLLAAFLLVDLAFLAANLPKILSGAWVPLALGLFVFSLSWIWAAGNARFHRALQAWGMPLDKFEHEMGANRRRREGTAVFFTSQPNFIPLVGKNRWLHDQACHQQVVLVSICQSQRPQVPEELMSLLEPRAHGLSVITASFGFRQHPDITRVLEMQAEKLKIDWDRLVCYLPEAYFIARGNRWHRTLQSIYQFMRRNSVSTAAYFRIPPGEIIRVGIRLEI